MEQNNVPAEYPGKPWQPLFDHLSGLCQIPPTLSEMDDLINVVEKMIGHRALRARADKMEQALNAVIGRNIPVPNKADMIKIARVALGLDGITEPAEQPTIPRKEDGYPDTPEMDLILKIVGNWGNAVEMPNLEGLVREYAANHIPTAEGCEASDPQEIWDEWSEYVDDDSDSFSRYAGRSVMLFDNFIKAINNIYSPQGAVWLTGQYDRLYDQLKAEPKKQIVCWVDYTWRWGNEVAETVRDICSVRGDVMGFNARGIGYGGAEGWVGDEKEKAEFLEECERLHVRWLDEGGEKEVTTPRTGTCQGPNGSCIDWYACERNNGCKWPEEEVA